VVSLDGHSQFTVADLIKAAGDAHDDARAKGGNRVQAIDDCKSVRVSTESVVMRMLAENRLQLRCQRIAPIGADSSDKPHFELLLGVKDESGALAVPRAFIQVAERNNEMHEVDMWVIRYALEWMAKHQPMVDAAGGYSINLSGLTLGDERLLRYVLERLTESQVSPSKIIFEVTESAAIHTLSVAVHFINSLKEYGCRFALDNFGTGDASFVYLKTLPIDFVKIDGSIVRDIVDSPKDLALVKSINEIGHFLGKKTVAEFVENDDILVRLRQMGVDYAQGYGIEAPHVLT
jgi:EAL domain-containing protein (putative c-di-GMP-specific phosphodiesterase class I)